MLSPPVHSVLLDNCVYTMFCHFCIFKSINTCHAYIKHQTIVAR